MNQSSIMKNKAAERQSDGEPKYYKGAAHPVDLPADSEGSDARAMRLQDIFEDVVRANPECIALTSKSQSISYAELNRRANRLAHQLTALGVAPETFVGIAIGRSIEFIVSVLAIVKAGAAYVPLDLTYPTERLNYILRDAHPSILLTSPKSGKHENDLDAPWATTIEVTSGLTAENSQQSDNNPAPRGGAASAVYVMYTSGSTGQPKGVVIEQRSIRGVICEPSSIVIDSHDTLLQAAPVCFDASTFEIWGALLNGARLVIMEDGPLSLGNLGTIIQQEQVTTLWLTAGLFDAMVDEQLQSLTPVRNLVTGGDVLSAAHVAKYLDAHRHSTLINGYGPTEATTFTCTYPVQFGDPIGNTIPIGWPINAARVYILDENRNAVPPGAQGELYIGGEGIARGYLNRPELTAERFVANPSNPKQRLYRSGDLVRARADGAIEFIGREDGQVKVRGFRIELGEIEAALEQHASVRQATAVVAESAIDDKSIHAFWIKTPGAPSSGAAISGASTSSQAEDLQQHLLHRLPAYMLPSTITRLDSLPLTANGKLDRAKLRSMAKAAISRRSNYKAPSDSLEMQLISIWEEILGVEPIGTRDDFFALGGHSLAAARMFLQVDQKLNKSLALATMFQAPTIEKLAQMIRAEGWERHWSSLVPIQRSGARPPLFLVHGIEGNVLTYYGLKAYLAAEQPLYGLQAMGLRHNRLDFFSIPEMAGDYLALIRSVQPSGPYFIGGFSAGGIVAYEMAQQLSQAGEEVKFLALFDPSIDFATGPLLSKFFPPIALLRTLRIYLQMAQQDGLGSFVQEKAHRLKVQLGLALWSVVNLRLAITGGKRKRPSRKLTVREAATLALREYEPLPYPGSAVLYRVHPEKTGDRTNGWGRDIQGTLYIREIEGHHNEIFREPHLGQLARTLFEDLDAAREPSRDSSLKQTIELQRQL